MTQKAIDPLGNMDPDGTVFEWLDKFTGEVVTGLAKRGSENPTAIIDKLSYIMRVATDGNGPCNLDTLFCYIAASHGLHAAAEEAKALGDDEWAADLHAQGQLFLQYATGDIEAITAELVQELILSQAVKYQSLMVH